MLTSCFLLALTPLVTRLFDALAVVGRGDLLVGAEKGIVVVPHHLAAEVAQPAADQEDLERFIQEKVAGGAVLRGTYPPNDQTLEEYRAWRNR